MNIQIHKSFVFLGFLLLAPIFFLLISPLPAISQGGFSDDPAIRVHVHYNFSGIAGPEETEADFWDELVIPGVLRTPDGTVAYVTFTKINVGESNTGDNGVNNQDNTSMMRFGDVASGTYEACITLQLPVSDDTYICTAQFDYEAGTDYITERDGNITGITLSAATTFDAISVGRYLGINEPPCPGSQIGWIVCPIAEQLLETFQVLFEIFVDFINLEIDPLDDSAADGTAQEALFSIWNSFRVIATVLFVILFLVAIFAQGLAGFQLFSAYDFKKMIPRLVIAAVGIQLSWYIAGFMVDLFNILGGGLRGIMLAPVDGIDSVNFEASDIGSNIGFFVFTGGLVSTFFAVGGIVGLLFLIPILLLNVFLAVIFGIFVMLLRNALILLGIIFSPIALALWALPNTSGLFTFWWDTFWRLLVMYPLVIGLVALGELMSRLVMSGNEGNIVWSIVALVVLFVPFFAIPYTFRVAQNIIGSVTTGLDGRRQLLSQRFFGSPDDEFSYRGRQRYQRTRYSTQRRYEQYKKHFIAPDKQGSIGVKRRLGIIPTPYFKGNKSNNLRTSWRKGYQTSIGVPGATEEASEIRGTKRYGGGTKGESWGQYAASLPRFALRMPGRMWAKARVKGAAWTGAPGIDDIMGQRNREARAKVRRMAQFGLGEEESMALFSNVNIWTGKPLSPIAIQNAKRFMNDDSVVQERMKLLVEKAAGIPYRRQILFDHWKGKVTPFVPPDQVYKNDKIALYAAGIDKGVAFGTQGIHRDSKHRTGSVKRQITAAEDRENRFFEDIAPEDRKTSNFLVGAGLIRDVTIQGALGELANNLRDQDIASFSGTNSLAMIEMSDRLYDLALLKTGEVDEQKLIDGDQEELGKLKQARHKRVDQKMIDSKVNKSLDDRDPRKLTNADLEKVILDELGNPTLEYIEGLDGVNNGDAMNESQFNRSIKSLGSLRAMALDLLAQGDTSVDEGDDDSADIIKPQVSSDQLITRWRRNDVAEYMWIEEIKDSTGEAPTEAEKQVWRNSDTGRAQYMSENAQDIYDLQRVRERTIIDAASTQQVADINLQMLKKFIEKSAWINDPMRQDGIRALYSTGALGTETDVDDILRDR